MTKISGFTFVHNAIESGYPIFEAMHAVKDYVDEIVIVDMESTDSTRAFLDLYAQGVKEMKNFMGGGEPSIRILDGKWGNQAGETLKKAHSLYKECSGDIILHFEADEVYDDRLLKDIVRMANAHKPITDIAVHRLQIEQNFQRCRWYPELVHRVFPRDSDTVKNGHTTNRHSHTYNVGPHYGFLWDITNCFRDNWPNRVKKQAELWHNQPENYFRVPLHALQEPQLVGACQIDKFLNEPHWTWKSTPFDIPSILKPLVGMVKYEPTV